MNLIDTGVNRPSRHFPPALAVPVTEPPPAESSDRLVFVDVLRGLAILGVVTVHVRYAFPDLPAAVRYVGGLGRFGVDLFFVVSAFTLIRSNGNFSLRSFLIRRWLRIAPVYYLGILFYGGVLRASSLESGSEADLGAILANLVFVNAWIPGAGNAVVPGGWSISTEVAFYALLPFALAFVTSLPRAIMTFAVTLAVSTALLAAISHQLSALWTRSEIGEFRSYCPLGHFPTFCLGLVLYHLLPQLRAILPTARQAAFGIGLIAGAIALLALLNTGSLPEILPRGLGAGVPAFLFSAGMALVLRSPRLRFVNALRQLGVISYGVYLIHFFVLDVIAGLVVAAFPIYAPGLALFATTWTMTAVFSVAGAFLLHHAIELPALRLARNRMHGKRPHQNVA